VKTKRPVETCYEIEYLIPPNDAMANVPVWVPVLNMDGRAVYHELSAADARKEFERIKTNGRRFRLLLVTRKVLAEKE
jgi:hypothetical protein